MTPHLFQYKATNKHPCRGSITSLFSILAQSRTRMTNVSRLFSPGPSYVSPSKPLQRLADLTVGLLALTRRSLHYLLQRAAEGKA
jgi:hypothetical protein